MTTALHIPRKELRPGTTRAEDGTSIPAWDLYLDGRLVASEYLTEVEAQMELDRIAWSTLFGGAASVPFLSIDAQNLLTARAAAEQRTQK